MPGEGLVPGAEEELEVLLPGFLHAGLDAVGHLHHGAGVHRDHKIA